MTADPLDCPKCSIWYYDQPPHLVGAAASVGIEHGLSTGQVLRRVIASYHRQGHPQELEAAVARAVNGQGAPADPSSSSAEPQTPTVPGTDIHRDSTDALRATEEGS